MLTFATASDCVQIWEVEAPTAVPASSASSAASVVQHYTAPGAASKTIRAHAAGGAVHAIQWNHNNGVLASGGSDGAICLTGVADGKAIMRFPPVASAGGVVDRVAALAFSSGSRYLCSAGGGGGTGSSAHAIAIWDLKKSDKSRRLGGHTAEVRALSFGAGDGSVSSGGDSGEILVHNLSLATLSARMAAPGTVQSAVRDLAHSTHSKATLASAHESGDVALWDENAGKRTMVLRAVTGSAAAAAGAALAPLNAVRFSPSSPALIVSAGLGGLAFYDHSTGRCIRTLSDFGGSTHPLLAMDWHAAGTVIITSAADGWVGAVDIRAANKPLFEINVGGSRPVNAVKFALSLTKPAGSSAAAAASAATSGRALYDSKVSTVVIDSRDSSRPFTGANATLPPGKLDLTSAAGGGAGNTTLGSNQTAPAGFIGAGGGGGGDLFSPVKSQLSATSQVGRQSSASSNGFASPPASYAPDSSLMLSPVAWGEDSYRAAPSTVQQQPPQPSHLQSTYAPRAATAAALPATSHLSSVPSRFREDDLHASHPPSPKRSQPAADSATTTASMQLILSPSRRTQPPAHLSASPLASPAASASFASSAAAPAPTAAASLSNTAGFSDAQVRQLRGLMDDSLYGLREEMRCQFNDLHSSMLRQFHEQQMQQTAQMDALCTAMRSMVDEVKELREDYKNLKHLY